MHAKEGSARRGRGGGTLIHTQRLPRRPAEETNTGKEENCGALPLQGASSILRDPAQGHFCCLFVCWWLLFHPPLIYSSSVSFTCHHLLARCSTAACLHNWRAGAAF